MSSAFVHGFLLAFGLILPLGVQNVFVFNQGALHKRFVSALPAVITAAVCDTLLISLAVTGVSVVVLGSYWLQTALLTVGVMFLLYMGWTTWNSSPPARDGSNAGEGERFSPGRQIAFAASVSLLNPHAILDTVGVIGTSSLRYSGSEKAVFALACILVSWLWFFGLALAGRWMGRLNSSGRFLIWLQKGSALIIWGSAIYIGASLFV